MVDALMNKMRTFVRFKPNVKIPKETIKNIAIKLYHELKPVFEGASKDLELFMGTWKAGCFC